MTASSKFSIRRNILFFLPGIALVGEDSFSFLSEFVFLTYVLGVAWLGVFGFSAVPVFMFYNIWSTCEVIKSPQTNGTAGVEQICVDIRQYGTSCAVP